ncbi:hypothetical protein GpartN1_g7114.t1 [Galdieria partita]|uniref:Uncharacterized protein n=1 Tax=Galdieria partita TaxID=83374 RepID=A0A9C7UTX1_9RHOD|nr:hypothetical protein GpartN1_g7114.t1 [Galdieria partita]
MSVERWPQVSTFSQVIHLVRETYQPTETIKNTIEAYLLKAIEIFCAKSFKENKKSSLGGQQQVRWRGKTLEPSEPECLKAKQLSQVLGISESLAVLVIREYISTVYFKFNDSVADLSLSDLIKYFYADEHAAYCFLAQILDICQDQEHPLYALCNDVWTRKVENEAFQLEEDANNSYSYADLGMQMLKNILDSEGILIVWKDSSNSSDYDKYRQDVLELESYRLLWTLELMFCYHYSHICPPNKLVELVKMLPRMTTIVEPTRTWHWKCYLTYYGLLMELLCLEEWMDSPLGALQDEHPSEKISKSCNDFDLTEVYTQMEILFSSRNYLGILSIAELAWSVFLYVISHKKSEHQESLLSEQQQQLWLSSARVHFSQAVSNGAIEELDQILYKTPSVNPYSLQETHGKLNGIYFGFLETLFVSFIPRQLNVSERTILNRLFVSTMKNIVPIIQRIWWIYQETSNGKYNGYHSLLLYSLAQFPLDMQSSCQLLSGLIGNKWSAYRLFQFIENEMPFYASYVDDNKIANIHLLSFEQFQLECNEDWLVSKWSPLGVPVVWNGYLITQDGQKSNRNCIGFYMESESKVVWRMQWNGWKYISYFLQTLLKELEWGEDSWQRCYSELIALLEMIHHLIMNGNDSCIDGILSYLHGELWIALYSSFMKKFLRAEPYSLRDEDTQELKMKQYHILQDIVHCLSGFVIFSPRLVMLLAEHVEEWCSWFPKLSKYPSILSSMLQIWTCLLHSGFDLLDSKKKRIFSQALYILRTKQPIGNKLLWETCDDLFLYTSCILCLSYAPLDILFPMDWLKPLEHFCNVWLSSKREDRNTWLSSLEWNTLDWRWFDKQNEEQRMQQNYSLLAYGLIQFIYKQNSSMQHHLLPHWWATLAHSRCLIRILAYLAFNAQQFALVHEQILKYLLLELEWSDSNWPKFIQFLFGEQQSNSQRSSSSMIASRCLIQLFQGLGSNPFHQDSILQVLWPKDEEANILVNSFLFHIASSDVCLSALSTFVVSNGWKSDQRGLSRSLISLPKSTSHPIEGFLKSKNMDFEWLSICVDLLSTLKRRLLDSNTCLLERGDGIRFVSLVNLLKEAWLCFGNMWLQDVWEKFGVWKLLLSFVSREWNRENVLAWLCRQMKNEDEANNDYLDEMVGWLEGICVLLDWFALEIFDSFRFSSDTDDDDHATFLWSLTYQELDLDGLEYFWTTCIESWLQSIDTMDPKESCPHLYSIMRTYENRLYRWMKDEKDSLEWKPLWYYETICIIPGEYFYDICYHPYAHFGNEKYLEILERMHRQTSRFQAIGKCVDSLYRLYFATMVTVSKEKNRFYSFWSHMWNKILDYLSRVPCVMTSQVDGMLARWLLDMAHQPKLHDDIYPLANEHIVSLDKAWKQSKNVFTYMDIYQSVTFRPRLDLLSLWQQPWEKNRKWLQVHLLYTFSKILSRQRRCNPCFSLWEDKSENTQKQNTATLFQVSIQVVQDAMQEDDETSSIEYKAVYTHAWSVLLCNLPREFLETLYPNMLKEWSQRILRYWKEWISMEKNTNDEEENRITFLLSSRWRIMDQLLWMHIKLWLAIPDSSHCIQWKETFLQDCISYASLDMYPDSVFYVDSQKAPNIHHFYDTLLRQRQPWHRYWVHRLVALSLHCFLSASHHSSHQVVLQWISTHVSFIEQSLHLFPQIGGGGDVNHNEEQVENPHSYWNFARIEEMEQLCTLLHSVYSDSKSSFQSYLPEVYRHLLICLYRYLYQVYRLLQTGVFIEWWIKPMTSLEHEQCNTSPIIKDSQSPSMKAKSVSSEWTKQDEETERFHLEWGSSPPFPSTPQAASPLFWKRRLELSPKKFALTQSSPERNRRYKSVFGQRVLYSLMRSLMLTMRCWKYAIEQDWEKIDWEPSLFLSSQKPSLGIFLAIPIMLVPYAYSISSSFKDDLSLYLDHILNDCFLIVFISGRKYEQQPTSSFQNTQPLRLKEDIAKRWFPLMEIIRQHDWSDSTERWYGWKCVKEWLEYSF